MEQNKIQDSDQRIYKQKLKLLTQTFELAGVDQKLFTDPTKTATLINQMPEACFQALEGFLVDSETLVDERQQKKALAQMMIERFVGDQSARD